MKPQLVADESAPREEVYLLPKLSGPLMPNETAPDALVREIGERPGACAIIRGLKPVSAWDHP